MTRPKASSGTVLRRRHMVRQLALVRRQRELANTTFEYGLAMTLLGQSESGLLGASLTKVGHTADQLSVVAAEQADKEARAIEARLYDYAALVAAARGAIGCFPQHILLVGASDALPRQHPLRQQDVDLVEKIAPEVVAISEACLRRV